MGILPLQFQPGDSITTLGLTGKEVFSIQGLGTNPTPRGQLKIIATREDGSQQVFYAITRLDTAIEIDYYRYGGILNAFIYQNT